MSERYLRRRIDDEEIVVDLEKGEFYGLNETAARILALWREGVREPAAIAARLVEEFEVEQPEAEAAAASILEEARAQGLLGNAGVVTSSYRLDGLCVAASVELPLPSCDTPPDWDVTFSNRPRSVSDADVAWTGDAAHGEVCWARFGRAHPALIVHLEGVLDLVAEPAAARAALHAHDPAADEVYLLRRAMPYLVQLGGGVALHAACAVIEGAAWLVGGDARAGKSTLALALDQAGCPVLADDHVALTFAPDGEIFAEASFPFAFVPPDSLAALRPDLPAALDKAHIRLQTSRPARAPLRRLAFLRRGAEARHVSLPRAEVATRLLRDVLFVGDPASITEQTRRLDAAAGIAGTVKAHALTVPDDYRALQAYVSDLSRGAGFTSW